MICSLVDLFLFVGDMFVHNSCRCYYKYLDNFRSNENSEDMDNWSWERVLCSDPELLIRQVGE